MDDTIELINSILSFSIFGFIITALAGFVLFCLTDKETLLRKYFRAVMPMYYMFLAFVLLCILLLLAFKGFLITLAEIIALIAWICALIGAVMAYRFGKKGSEKFKSFTRKKYVSDIILCSIVCFLWVSGI
jgi:ABC-type transport system involved in cytochrome bd biosynthesis fused ATPase/permease subunit